MIRTCLKLQMLLWYYSRAEPYAKHEPNHARSEAVCEQRQELIDEGMITGVLTESEYEVTDRGRCYIEYILKDIGYPKQAWSME